jgi:hypothetical protein
MAIVLSDSISSTFEPKRKNRFIFQFDEVPGGSADGKDAESLAFVAHTAKKPDISFNAVELHRINEKFMFAGKPTWGDMSATFYDHISVAGKKSAATILEGWLNKIYNPRNGQMGYAVAYKRNGAVVMLDGLGNVIDGWDVFMAWPMTVDFGDLSEEDDGIVDITATFKYDYAVRQTETIQSAYPE